MYKQNTTGIGTYKSSFKIRQDHPGTATVTIEYRSANDITVTVTLAGVGKPPTATFVSKGSTCDLSSIIGGYSAPYGGYQGFVLEKTT